MLLAHPVPHHIVVGKAPPALADLSSMAERGGVKIGEDAEGNFRRSDGEEVDSQQGLQVV